MTSAKKKRHQQKLASKQSHPQGKGFWNGTRIALACTALIIVVVIGWSLNSRSTEESKMDKSASATTTPPVSVKKDVAPPTAMTKMPESVMDAQIETLDGKSLRLSDYAGKVVVLDVWATWCGPCRKEVPFLVEMRKKYASRGLEVVGLTLEDPVTDAEKVRDFSREFKVNYKLGWADRNFALAMMRDNGNIPQTFVIAPDGRIVKRFIGFDAQKSPPEIRETIEQALGAADGV